MAQPLNGMTPIRLPTRPSRRMPSEWTRTYKSASGKDGRVFTSLYGASEDLLNEGYRRLLVNGCLWALGMEDAIKPDLNVEPCRSLPSEHLRQRGYRVGVKPSALRRLGHADHGGG